ncbi:MAG TPA: hypothetical protein VIL99_17840 [Ignavibacteria bacterium]
MKKINKLALISIFIFVLCNISFAQSDNFINQYDPYVTTPKKLTFYYPVDDDPLSASSKFAIFIYGTIGSQKDAFIKIITADKIGFDASKELQDGYLQDISIMDLRGILVPPIKDMGGSNFLVLNIRLYAGFNETDYAKLKRISDEGTVTINSSIINPFMGFYSFYGSKNEVYKPTDENWAEVQVFLSGMGTRQKVDCGGIELVIPYVTTVTNIKSGDNFVPGDKVFEDKKSNSMAIVNFKLVNNELLVMAQDYYKKLLDRFLKYAGNSIYNDALPGIMEELNDFKSVGFKDKNDVYVSPEAKKQLMYVLDLLILGQPIKADTTVNTSRIPLEGELVLDYFRANISGDKTKSNRYIFEDFIGNDMNRIKLQRELELVRNYYNIK